MLNYIVKYISGVLFKKHGKLLSNKENLVKDWNDARNNFTSYAVMASYTDNYKDSKYFTNMAYYWDKTASNLRIKYIKKYGKQNNLCC